MNLIHPVLFKLGPFEIRWYGLLIMTGVALGAYFSTRLARKRGLDPDHVWGALILAVVLAILGARLYHVFSTPAGCPPDATYPCGWPYYRHHFFEAFAVWKTGGFQGMGIFGAIVGGALGVLIYTLWNGLNPLVWLDIAAPGLAFGQFVGRWGNFVNQELYGPPTGSAWFGLRINPDLPHQALPPGMDYATRFHPTFLYESLWSLGTFLLLYNLYARLPNKLRNGDIFVLYLVLYGLGRFLVEFFRPDAWTMGRLATAQWIGLGLVVGGIIFLVLRHVSWNRNDKADQQDEVPSAEQAE